MKVYLDDIREPNEDWVWVRRPSDAIRLLSTGGVEVISLDHDLGASIDSCVVYKYGTTGYDVLLWIEEHVARFNFNPPEILIHTDNPPARRRMEAAVKQIQKLLDSR